MERALVDALLSSPALTRLVDELYWEHEVVGSPMVHRGWRLLQNQQPGEAVDTLADSYALFGALRQRGIRAHSWV